MVVDGKAHFADRAKCHSVTIRENRLLAKDTYLLRFDCPRLAQDIVPGQFLMLRLAGSSDPLLGRPLALYDTILSGADANSPQAPIGIEVVYLVVGKMTSKLAHLAPGQALEAWGPLGNGFTPRATDHLIMVAGGIGQTPFKALGREYLGQREYGGPQRGGSTRSVTPAQRVTLCYGARNAGYLAGVDEFRELGLDVRISTDDGSLGHHGVVTDLLGELLKDQEMTSRVVCCGPEPMLRAVAKLTEEFSIPCEVSLETPMACGIGICFSCVTRVKEGEKGWDYRRTCVEGPVFDASEIAW